MDKRVNLSLYHLKLILAHAVVYRFDGSMINGLQAVPAWDACEAQLT